MYAGYKAILVDNSLMIHSVLLLINIHNKARGLTTKIFRFQGERRGSQESCK